MQNHQQIQTFLVVAELGSFRGAAKKLYLSPMAVSKQIKKLEERIKEQLFIRTTRKVNLTEFGEGFYQQCKVLEKHWQNLDSFIASRQSEPQGKLKIYVARAFGFKAFSNKLEAFTSTYPKIELDIKLIEEPPFSEYKDNQVDILFGFPELPGITDSLKFRELFKVKNVLCASKKFIEQYGEPEKVEDLVNFKFINHNLREPNNIIKLAGNKTVLTAKPGLLVDSFEFLTQCCCEGMGIFLTSDSLAQPWLDSGELVELLPDLDYREFTLCVFYRPMNYEQPSVRAFVDFYTG